MELPAAFVRPDQVASMRVQELCSGVDALYVSGQSRMPDDLVARLEEGRGQAGELGGSVEFDLGGQQWRLADRGRQKYRYVLNSDLGPLPESEAVPILVDIAHALESLESEVVHRDLKPDNLLLLDGVWCLADFGISRYAAAATATETHKYSMSVQYAAPEQWRLEHAEAATDIYALGVIAYKMLSGKLPFDGPQIEDFRDQHLHRNPRSLPEVSTVLQGLVMQCLEKAPGARPSASAMLKRLALLQEPPVSSGRQRLREAANAAINRNAEASLVASISRTAAEKRNALGGSALNIFEAISDELRATVTDDAPIAQLRRSGRSGWALTLNGAQLMLNDAVVVRHGRSGQGVDVVMTSEISIRMLVSDSDYSGRSHSLWFCDAQTLEEYAWFETAFMELYNDRPHRIEPFAAEGDDAASALSPAMTGLQVARPFTPLALGSIEEFVDRWASLFADAASGLMRRPSQLPEGQPHGSWRR